MLNLEEINEEIAKLEKCNCTTYDICQKLAILYIVRDHNNSQKSTRAASNPAPMQNAMTM